MEMHPRGHKPLSPSHNELVMPITNDDLSFLQRRLLKTRFIKMSPGLNVLGVQQVRGS